MTQSNTPDANEHGTQNNQANKSTQNCNKKGPNFSTIMLASGLGTLIVLCVIGLFKLISFFAIIGAMSSMSDNAPVVSKGTFLKIDLSKPMAERSSDELEALFSSSNYLGFNDLMRSINTAADDDNISGIYLHLGSTYPLSWGNSEELRQCLTKFSQSGKPILAYSDSYTQQSYFLASIADSIYLNPSGMVQFRGICAEVMFYKEMLDRLSVKMTLVRPKSNSYKSAGETYTMDHMSDANRTQVREYITSIWNYALEKIGESRDISIESLNTLADNLQACLPEDALKNGIVDRLCFENDVKSTMRDAYEGSKILEVSEYFKTLKESKSSKNKIAIIYAEGTVVDGTGYNTAVYGDKITKALDDAAKDDKIKAIVLRVNSPGGQVTASEIMTNAVIRAKQHKPVIVSMGDVAASAGYEISCNANYIIAEPTTLTGSIGVFATIPEVGGTLKRYLGITTDTVKTNANSSALSILRPMSPEVLDLMQRNVEDFYKVFVGRVAKGRGLEYDYVDSIAKGRVWTGRDALELGLVDALGGLDDAIQVAAEQAGIDKYQVIDYPEEDDFLTELLNRAAGNESEKLSKLAPVTNKIGAEKELPSEAFQKEAICSGDGVWVPGFIMVKTLNRILDSQGLQARVEFFILSE